MCPQASVPGFIHDPWASGEARHVDTQPEGGPCPGPQPLSMLCSGTGHRQAVHGSSGHYPFCVALERHSIPAHRGSLAQSLVLTKMCPTCGGRGGWEYNSVWNEHSTLVAGPTPSSTHGAQADLIPASWSKCFLAPKGVYLSYLQVGFLFFIFYRNPSIQIGLILFEYVLGHFLPTHKNSLWFYNWTYPRDAIWALFRQLCTSPCKNMILKRCIKFEFW